MPGTDAGQKPSEISEQGKPKTEFKPPASQPYQAPGPSFDETSDATEFGPTVKIKGEIEGGEDVVIKGRVEGMLNLKKNLVVDESGVVFAEIHAASVTIHGSVNGNIVADKKVEISAKGRVEGNIKAPKIQIHEGAHFKGNVEMVSGSIVEKISDKPTEE